MQTISVFEHQSLKVGENGLTTTHLEALERFLGNNDETTFPYYSLIHKGVKFRQFVGVLCINDLTIEVLPKTDRDNDNDHTLWRERLLFMLSKVYKLDVMSPSKASQKTSTNSPILDIFIKRFLDEVDSLLNRGLVKCYHKIDGNKKALKGKLLWSEHLRSNYIHKEHFYVRYTTYDYEHVMNCLLRQAIEVSATVTQNVYLRGRAFSTLFNFPELKEIAVTPELFGELVFDRKTEDYRMAIKLAKLLLQHTVPNRIGKGDRVLALMFDMNKLWEEYVYITLRRSLKDYDVRAQESKVFWKRDTGFRKHIKPDIVIRKKGEDNVTAILDTKWKCPDQTPSDGDLHQMFVYSKMFGTNKVGLLYPSTSGNILIPASFVDQDISCDMFFLEQDLNNGINYSIKNWIQSISSLTLKTTQL